MNSTTFLQVAIPSPLRLSFDYLLPAKLPTDSALALTPKPGSRVKVPFGKREVIGIVIGVSDKSNIKPSKLKPIIEVLDQEPILNADVLKLYQWASAYYFFPIGQALQTSLPKFIKEGRPLYVEQESWRLTDAAKELSPAGLKRSPQQQKVFELIKTYQYLSTGEASALLEANARPFLLALATKNLLECFRQDDRKPTSHLHSKSSSLNNNLYGSDKPQKLNPEQKQAVTQVSKKLDQNAIFLLEGVTGSGKTEVYLHLIAEVLEKGQQVLVLVPEINLTPQTISRFKQRFTQQVISLHSGLNDTQRFNAWKEAKEGTAKIIIGTRSAIFTPLPKPGLIIIDEEHDSSYKQQEGFRYNARDLAILRARLHKIPILLGSATPSLESLSNALSSRYTLLQLSQRAGTARMPQYKFIDLKNEELQEGFSPSLLQAIKEQLSQRKQVLIFINRRGFSPILQCQSCGWIANCTRCDTSYTLHQHPPGLRCHHCDFQHRLLENCPQCSSPQLSAIGIGTERSEQFLSQIFDNTPVLRIDRDSTRNKGSLDQMLEVINKNEPCILIGTQMLAKGHHFPCVSLVAILDADNGLFSADFRGQEKMGQLLTQVAGRAGRSKDVDGQVLIQTYHSTHPALQSLIHDGYAQFARQLLEDRRSSKLPPYSYHILFRAEAGNQRLPEQFLAALKIICQQNKTHSINIFGPMPAPMEKRAGRFRAQLLLQCQQRKGLHHLTHILLSSISNLPLARKVRWSIDVDPLDFT